MKKSKIKPEEFLKDLNNTLNLINELDNIDIETDINKLSKKIKNTTKKRQK